MNEHEEFIKEMTATQGDTKKQGKLMVKRTGMYIAKITECIDCTPMGDQAFILAALKITSNAFRGYCDPMARLIADTIVNNTKATFEKGIYTKEEYEEMMRIKK